MEGKPLDDSRFRIAEAARMTGVSASTLRLWEAQGLIEPARTSSGQRLYDRPAIDRLKAIMWLRNEEGLNPAAIRHKLAEQAPPSDGGEDAGGRAEEEEARSDPGFGWKLRRLRRDAGMTLETVAQAAGVSTSVLSTFERTSQGLSLTTLHAVAHHLGTTIAALSGESDTPHESLVRAGEWVSWPKSNSGVVVQELAKGRRQMECHRFLLPPGASSEGAYEHDGEEFIHVLQGSLDIVLDGDRFFRLDAGDSFYFESRRPHSWRNVSDGETILIWINTPPTF